MKKWEYKRIERKLSQNELSVLGEAGWEMVSHTVIDFENFWTSKNAEYYMFKRQKNEQINS
jgi:hypothetical protein